MVLECSGRGPDLAEHKLLCSFAWLTGHWERREVRRSRVRPRFSRCGLLPPLCKHKGRTGARGFETSLGYFHGAEDHYTQTVPGNIKCPGHLAFNDLWLNDAPAKALNGTDYNMHLFRDRALALIDAQVTNDDSRAESSVLWCRFFQENTTLLVSKRYRIIHPHAAGYCRHRSGR